MTAARPQASPGELHLVPGLFELGPDGPRLRAGRCRVCSSSGFPARLVCPRCKSRDVEPVLIGERGRLYSFTVCHAAPSGWEAPYLQAYVELPEGIRVFTLVASDVAPRSDALSPGMRMELIVEPVRPDDPMLTYKYRPADRDA